MRLDGFALVLAFAFAVIAACGGTTPPPTTGARQPQTAAERAKAEQPDEEKVSAKGKKWGGWRYQGSRDTCFFVVKRRCFDKREDACAAAGCGKSKKACVVEGGGPATVRCE